MSWRCGFCRTAVPHGKPLRRQVLYRHWTDTAGNKRKDILSEVPICPACEQEVRVGRPPRVIAGRTFAMPRLQGRPIVGRPTSASKRSANGER